MEIFILSVVQKRLVVTQTARDKAIYFLLKVGGLSFAESVVIARFKLLPRLNGLAGNTAPAL
jgi:hypothetical protein